MIALSLAFVAVGRGATCK